MPVFSCPPHLPYTHKCMHAHTHFYCILCHLIQTYSNAGVDVCPHSSMYHPGDTALSHSLFYQKSRLNNQCEHGFRQSLRGNRGGGFLSTHLLLRVILGQGLWLRLHRRAGVQNIMIKAWKHTPECSN